jgi:hypothetical protein
MNSPRSWQRRNLLPLEEMVAELRLRHWEQPNELAWPPPKPFDPGWFAPVPFDRRYSAEWLKVKEEEARAVRERKEREAAEEEAKQRELWRGPRWWEESAPSFRPPPRAARHAFPKLAADQTLSRRPA